MSPTSATCALTFDDGPDPRWTPRILDLLRAENAPATFFVIAPRAERHADLIDRMVREGHEVQLHCDRHRRHSDMSEAALRRDVDGGLKRLAGVGIAPRRWRAPWGVCTPATHRVAAERELALVSWDVDTHDWRGDRAADMLARVAESLRGGSIVLMHDGIGPGARRSGCRQTLELIPHLMRTLHERGLRAARVGEQQAPRAGGAHAARAGEHPDAALRGGDPPPATGDRREMAGTR